ncbi:hypothetical protein DWF00_07330 [Bosea caraganae]|uniref:DUF3313 domain-containing protein n=1 Tax=Bosea caraganae TaxID=2763117 RepID=A0A370L0Y3_9HYPH|nr:hypothetical protein [Bosea caraganae]RDJ21029.1 hypothetical protein DWE98_22125 [Bosea caraganae]RDJ28528.1 hypothetical protein DWF00_07330 [Bosea caraganae]
MLHRRALILSGLAAALAGCQTTPPLGAGIQISAVRVDVSRLVELGVGPYAATIKAIIERDLTNAFAPDGRRGGATVTVAVRSLFLSAYVGSDFDDGEGSDSLDSLTTVTDANGRVLATYPVNASNGSGDAGAWYDPNLIDKRIARLATNHALWIKRMVQG